MNLLHGFPELFQKLQTHFAMEVVIIVIFPRMVFPINMLISFSKFIKITTQLPDDGYCSLAKVCFSTGTIPVD